MQKVGGRMHDAFGTGAAGGVATPREYAHETGSHRRRDDVEPDRRGALGLRRQGESEHGGEQDEQECAYQPGAAKIGLQENDPEDARGKKTSAAGRSLIDAATRTNHANPDAAVSTRLIQANQASGGRTAAGTRASFSAFAKAGSAMNTTKKTTPATAIVAA